MKNISKIVFLIVAVISVALMGYAIYVGTNAPESAKIAGNMALVQQFDENGEPINNEDGKPMPVRTTDEGIEALKTVFATQYKAEMDTTFPGLTLDEVKAKREENKVAISELEAKLAEQQAAYNEAKAALEELKSVKYMNGTQKKEFEAAQKVAEEYAKAEAELKTRNDNEVAWSENIPAIEEAMAQSVQDAENVGALAQAISINILWFYFLMVFAVVFVIFQAVLGMFQSKGGIVKAVVSLVVVAVIVGVAYFVADGHGWSEGTVLYDVKGMPLGVGNDPASRTVFGAFEYMTADVCILVTYIAFIGAALAAIYSAVRSTFKS